jgi:hypothetical protein
VRGPIIVLCWFNNGTFCELRLRSVMMSGEL